jgi:hypothetical protein
MTSPGCWMGGKIKNGLSFDGSGDYVNVLPNTSSLPVFKQNTAHSIALWVNANYSGYVGNAVWAECEANTGCTNSEPHFEIRIAANGKVQVHADNDLFSVFLNKTSTGTAFDGAWHHIVWTDNNGTATLYIDGSADATSFNYTRPGSIAYTQNVIGATNGWGAAINGTVDDVRAYNRVLSGAEVTQLYAYGGGCANPAGAPGTVMYNSTRNVMQYCEGRNWRPMGPDPGTGGAGCSNPAKGKGSVMFNSTSGVMQYCDGTNWRTLGGEKMQGTTAGLVGWWKLDESSGNAVDSIGGNTATINGNPVWQPSGGKVNGALQLDGTGDFAESTSLGITATSSTSFTIAWWIKTNESIQKDMIGWSPYRFCELQVPSAGLLSCSVNSDAWASGLSTTTVINNNIWHHIAWTLDNGSAEKIYVDGKLEGSVTENIDTSNPAGIYIGGRSFGNETSGYMDDVRVYNRALSAGEILRLYQTTGGQ